MNNIFLIGFMGSGKSAVCSRLHELTGMEVIEMDASIVDSEQMSINDIFASKGEEYFRDLETNLIKLISEESNKAVSCGGGAILRPANVEYMKKSGKIVLLSATPETIYERVKDSTNRPLLNGNMNIPYIAELMKKRQPRYEAAAEITIDVNGKTLDEICNEIIEKTRQ
ncbi:shikimate kinase [Eubacterium ruminantium]|nr:shikimate kinase [Eubacterium ruminantium]